MTEEQVFSHMALIRSRTVKWIEAIDPAIVDVITVELLLQELREQTARLQSFISGKLADKLAIPFLHYVTLEESFGYSLYHEGIHLGYMMGLKRAIEAKTA